ncbi:AAA family ATPase [Jannaschia sp. W003]|uniref:ATP-binding protein n=1 Tax=Jannaschia sp. W003 TaxID=2867012 RepID=UPI0021A5A520|nr:adenylate/guanylate cyclase domain-containing protein [Jannaschia sp. W003]UWQ23112.1 AAA family ATPase [Jannaschia sp. W003]
MTDPTSDARRAAILAVDVVGSTEMARRVGPEAAHACLSQVRKAVRAAVERHGGIVVDEAGDGVLAAFGAHRGVENAALQACRAALETRGRLADGLAVRMGLAEGSVMVARERGGIAVIGDAVVLAARLEQAAGQGEILLDPAIADEVGGAIATAPREACVPKGFDAPIRPAALLGLAAGAAPPAPLVGRQAALLAARAALSGDARGRTLWIEGEAGMGKSRLAGEVAAALTPRRPVLVGRCADGALSADHAPLIGLLRDAAGPASGLPRAELLAHLLAEDPRRGDDGALARFLGAAGDADPVTRAEANRDFLSGLILRVAARRDAALWIEDVHWIDGASLAVLRDLGAAPVDLILTARPGRDPAAFGRAATALVLDPMDAASLANVAAGAGPPLSPDLAQLVAERAEGLPFAAKEVIRALGQQDLLERRGDGRLHLAGPAGVVLTGNLQQMVLSRTDRLPEAVREALRFAALLGREVSEAALSEALGRPADLALAAAAPGLLEPAGPGRWRFDHALVRDAIAESLLPSQRRIAHGAILDARARAGPARPEEAGRLARHALGAGREAQAARHLVSAAAHRLSGYAVREALRDCERAAEISAELPDALDDAAYRRLAATWLRALDHLGDYRALDRVFRRLRPRLEAAGPSPELSVARTLQAIAVCHLRDYGAAEDLARRSLWESEAANDRPGAAWARAALMRHHDETGCPTDEIVALAEEIGPAARAAGDVHLEMTALYLLSSAFRSAGRRLEALAVIEQLDRLETERGDRRAGSYAAWARALLHAIEDDPEAAGAAVAPALRHAIPGSGDARVGRAIDLYARGMREAPDPLLPEVDALVAEGEALGDMNVAHAAAWLRAVLDLRAGRLSQAWGRIARLGRAVEAGGNVNLIRQTLLLRAEVLLAVGGLPAPGARRPAVRPGLADLLTWARLRPSARRRAAVALQRCLEMDRSGGGSHAARCHLGLARLAAATGRAGVARGHLRSAREAAAREDLAALEDLAAGALSEESGSAR